MSNTPPGAAHASASILFRLRFALAVFTATLLLGTFGHMMLLDLDLIDAFYFTVITLTTVGYGDIYPKTDVAELFAVAFLLIGILTASYAMAIIVGAVVEGQIQGELGRRKKLKKINELREHVIVCGYGRIGRALGDELEREGIPYLIVESSPEAAAQAEHAGRLALVGDATDEEILKQAGLDRARAIVPALSSDADNLYIVMSARLLNPRLTIIPRAMDEAAAGKMMRAGATNVVRPLFIGAQHLAQAVLRPNVLDFMQLTAKKLAIEEIFVEESSRLAGRALNDIDLRKKVNIIVIGIKRVSGDLIFNPGGTTAIEARDTLVVLGEMADMDRLSELARGPQA